MPIELLLNRTAGESRSAVLEDGRLVSLAVEREGDRGVVGNIYLGRVVRVLPGMQAAFVDIGLERAAFLYVGEVPRPRPEPVPEAASDPDDDTDEDDEIPVALAQAQDDRGPQIPDEFPVVAADAGAADGETTDGETTEAETTADPESSDEAELSLGIAEHTLGLPDDPPIEPSESPLQGATAVLPPADGAAEPGRSVAHEARRPIDTAEEAKPVRKKRRHPPIETLLHPGQVIIVQVTKDPIGTKGARLTGNITLPGRFLVYLAETDSVGVSRRIAQAAERDRLRSFVDSNRRQGEGFIVRTVCEGLETHNLAADMDYLRRTWVAIAEASERRRAPALLHRDLDQPLRIARDLFTDDVERFVVDDEDDYNRVLSFMSSFMPRLRERLDHYRGPEPIFDAYGVEQDITRALNRRVWLRSGGYIVIDQTEALTAIDVNTGRYVGRRSLEETTLHVNLEAAVEVVRQIRIRDIGGIIIIDFIDMEQPENREAVYGALQGALSRDHARTNVLPISEFGLVEMTRKRVREDLVKYLSSPCGHCSGNGITRSVESAVFEILREVERQRARHPEAPLTVSCTEPVAALLAENDVLAGAREVAPVTVVERAAGRPDAFEVSVDAAAAPAAEGRVGRA